MNVIGNAIKFTETGKVHVAFRLLNPNDGISTSSHLEVTVSDAGPGIATENRDKLFRPFTQADSGTTRKYGGAGLGLYLSRRLALALGGDLRLQSSESGHGSTFVLTIDAGPRDEMRGDRSLASDKSLGRR